MTARFRIAFKLITMADPLLAPIVFCCAKLLWAVRWFGIRHFPRCKQALFQAKVFPVRDHYYEPFFQPERKLVFDKERDLFGLAIDLDGQLGFLKRIAFPDELRSMPLQKQGELDYYVNNGFFEGGEADCWYGVIRGFKPKRIIEIGSGQSTKLAVAAIRKNVAENPAYECEHICIEPFEQPWLESLPVQVIREQVETLPCSLFESLSEDDILFIDSSHVIRPQSDVLFEYLSILPRLNKGVLVHIHDIYTPMEYPQALLVRDRYFWNEQYLLEAFLSQNPSWKIELSCYYLFVKKFGAFQQACPLLSPSSEPVSLYLRRV